MEYYNNILCISGFELIRSERNPRGLLSKGGYDSLVNRKRMTVLRRACNETPSLIAFDSLPAKYKALAKEFCDPTVQAQEKGIRDYIESDAAAVRFFETYTVEYSDNVKGLDAAKQLEYVNNAIVLNALKKAWDEHVLARQTRTKRPLSSEFWTNSIKALPGLMKDYPHGLKYKNWRRLQEKMREYCEVGYACLVSGKIANENTVKITEEVGEWLIARWSTPIEIVTLEQLHALYNVHAENMPRWKKIKSSQAVRDYLYRPEIEEQWYAARYGDLAYKEKYVRQHKTRMPSYRDSLWYSDGTKLNFYYQDEQGKTQTWQVYEVLDVYSECFLGYHISKSEDFEAQYAAFKMAIQTSGHKPYELKYDNQGGHKKLKNGSFLDGIARHAIPTAPYNGKSKTIESVFHRFQRLYLHQQWYFTGQNITATKQESRARMEFILANLKKLPTLEEVKAKYAELRMAWNNAPHHKTGIARSEMYRTSVNDKTQAVDFLDMISMFGITTKDGSTYRASGIRIDVKKTTYQYEVLDAAGKPDTEFTRRNIGRKFHVRYNLDDMSIVSLHEKTANDMRFVSFAQTYISVQRNLQEQTSEDLQFIRQTEMTNKLQRIANAKQSNELLEKHNLHPNQHGLNVAKPKGLNVRKKPVDIGEIQKEVSNMTELEEQKKADTRARKKASKQAKKQEVDDQSDYNRRKKELLEMSLN